MRDFRTISHLRGQIIANRVRKNKISVGQALHECTCSEAVGAMIREISFTDHIESREVAHQIIINPESAHRVVDRRINAHRYVISDFAGDALVHVKEVTVALLDRLFTKPFDRIGEIEINSPSARTNPAAFVANLFRTPGRNITRRQIPVTRILPLKIIIALGMWDLSRRSIVPFLLRNPDPAIISKRFAHQSQLRLMVPTCRNTGRVNLRKTGIREKSSFFVSSVRGRYIRSTGIGRKIEKIAVTASSENNRVSCVRFDRPGNEISHDDSLRVAVDNDQVEHLGPWKHFYRTGSHLAGKRRITTEKKLLSRLSSRVKCAGNLCTAERSVGERATIFARKRNSLRDRLIDDISAVISHPVDIRLAGPVVATFQSIVKEPLNAVAVVLIIFRRFDPPLCSDTVRTARTILYAKTFYVVAEFAKRSGSRTSG